MKFVFFSVLLINIIFFFWEYRKGAPEVYLPPVIEYAKNNVQKIFLIDKPADAQQDKNKSINSDLRQVVTKSEKLPSTLSVGEGMEINVSKQLNIDTEHDKLSTSDSEISVASEVVGPIPPELREPLVEQSPELIQAVISEQDTSLEDSEKNTVSDTLDTIAHVKTLTTCYQLLKSEYKQKLLSQTNLESSYTMSFTEQEVPYVSSYLVLTLAAESIQQAEKRQEEIKQQGISDLWVFKQGKFKWRISLGLFSTLEKAEFAKEQYAQQITQSLAVVPSWQTHTVTKVTINAQQDEIISDFVQKFSSYIDKEVDCL